MGDRVFSDGIKKNYQKPGRRDHPTPPAIVTATRNAYEELQTEVGALRRDRWTATRNAYEELQAEVGALRRDS